LGSYGVTDPIADRVACLDGTLHVWSMNSNLARPDKSCEAAHVKGSRTSGVVFARDGRRLATRGGDDTVKREPYPFSAETKC
jgi:WD40 repeat protein